MPADAFLSSGSVGTTIAPASPSGMQADASLDANGSRPSINGPHPPSPTTSPSSGAKPFSANPVLSRSLPVESDCLRLQSPSSMFGAGQPQVSGFPPSHRPLGSPSHPPQVANNSCTTSFGAATAYDAARQHPYALNFRSLSDFGASPASWPDSSSPSIPLSHLGLGAGQSPAALNDLLPTFPSAYPTSAKSLHASLFSGFGPGPVSPPASVGVGSRSPYASPQSGTDTSCGFPFPPSAPASAPIPSPGAGPDEAFLDTLPPTSPPSRVFSPAYFGTDAVSVQALPRSLSADATANQHALFEVVHLLRQQLSFLVQAWMADRERLGPSQQQTEGEVQRMQAAMDGAREHWISERSVMEHQVEVLKAQVHRLQDENAAFRAVQASNGNEMLSPDSQREGGLRAPAGSSSSPGTSGPAAALRSPNSSLQSGSSKTDIFLLPPGLDGASRRPHFASPGSSRTSPMGAPGRPQTTSLDPRTQPQNSVSNDFLAPLSTDEKLSASVIDVQQIDPKLEGIPIKANAVQRSTFALAGSQTSPMASARKNGLGRVVAARRRDSPARRWSPHNLSMDRGRAPRPIRASSRDHTMQVLAAEESRRLTMHAGHTPNHSFSLLPTMTATGGDSTGCQSRGATPSVEIQAAGDENDEVPSPGDHETKEESDTDSDLHSLEDAGEGMEENFEAQDDVPLKGPLMIKNIPAQDDIFFAKLDERLQSLCRGRNALPSVLQTALEEPEQAAAGPSCVPGPHQQPMGGDASCDSRSVPEEEADGEDGKHVEPEVPLKFKSTRNFGAPFGSM